MIAFAKPALVGLSLLGILSLGMAVQPTPQDELQTISLFNCDIDVRSGGTVTAQTDVYWEELASPKLGVKLTFVLPAGVSLMVGNTAGTESVDLAADFENTVQVEYERGSWGERIKVTVKTTADPADDEVFYDAITTGAIDVHGLTSKPYLTEARPPAEGVERARLWVVMYGMEYALTLTG